MRGIGTRDGEGMGSRPARHARWRTWGRLALPLLALLALPVAACGPTTASAGVAADQTFTWPVSGASGDTKVSDLILDPAEVAAFYDAQAVQMIYTGLVTLGTDLSIQLDAARSIEVDATGTVYTFHLRSNLRFSDGTPLRAADFAYAIDRALDPHLCDGVDANGKPLVYGNSPYGANCTYVGTTYLIAILGAKERAAGSGGSDHSVVGHGDDTTKGVDVVDDQTLVIRLVHPAAYFLEALTYSSSFPLEQSLVDKYKNGQWVFHLDEGGCSGPFKIGSYGNGKTPADGTSIVYVPNSYWEAAHGQKLTLTKVVRPFMPDADTEYQAYRGGQNDYTDVPGADYAFARGQDDFHEVGELNIQYFGLNAQVPPFDSLDVRRAFSLALNKQLLVDRIVNGAGTPTNHIVPQGMPGFDPGLLTPPPDRTQSVTGNQAAAVQLLGQAQQNCHGNTPAGVTPVRVVAPDLPADPDYCPYIDAKDYPALKEVDIYTGGGNTTRVQIAQAAVQQWSTALGMNVQTKHLTLFGDFLSGELSGQFGMWAIGWLADYPDPQDWLSLQFATGALYNSEHVADPTLDSLLAKADTEQNPAMRLQEYNQAEQMVSDLVPWIPYEQEKVIWRQRAWVHGFGLNAISAFPDIAWPQVYITSH
jgi:peptide/nickel transport system substrate-binding protein/oligopeptide transport system substrate-binding protein